MSSVTNETNTRADCRKAKREAKNIASAEAYKMLFGTPTYRQQRFQRSDRRTVGFELLGDKEQMAKRLVKTKVCRNLEKHGKCTRKVCTFAHSPDELIDPECVFGKTCRKRSRCPCKHVDETSEEYRARRGIRFPEPKPKNLPHGEITYQDLVKNVLEENIVPPTPKHSLKVQTVETVLRVPKEMAQATMELAIKQGKQNIRIELI